MPCTDGNRIIRQSENQMAIADLKNVLSIFGGSESSANNPDELFKEVLLMTLSRAAVADINIQAVEVERIREILKEHTGQDFSASDIRVAAREELYAEATLVKYLAKVNKKMRPEDRGHTIQALAEVFRSGNGSPANCMTVLPRCWARRRRRSRDSQSAIFRIDHE